MYVLGDVSSYSSYLQKNDFGVFAYFFQIYSTHLQVKAPIY